MRCPLLALALCAALAATASGQDPQSSGKKDKLPESGDTIVVKGCISGSRIQDIETGFTFRLKGKKDLVKKIGKDHNGHMDEITGVLRSSLRMGGTKSTRVGRTTVTIGLAESRGGGAPQEFNPVLEVTSIEHLPGVCAK